MEIYGLIPARYQSTRFPGKPLAEIAGKPMIEHVYERCVASGIFSGVIVATDDQRIYKAVHDFGGRAEMTSREHTSGTDRIAEVARNLSCDLVVNIQGDEPLIKGKMIKKAVQPFYADQDLQMSTLKKELVTEEERNNPDIVKVVCNNLGEALYFSRSRIPFFRGTFTPLYKHIGLYVYRRDFLLKFTEMEPTPLEKAESLEQLRVLENGYRIKVIETEYNSIGVDRPEDVNLIEKELVGNEREK
ncbi:MAG: 3-deoxy-manno-octulosonate cytidylyltransferase [Bacillota bacterium]